MIEYFENFNKLNEGRGKSSCGVVIVELNGEVMKVYYFDTIEDANSSARILAQYIANATEKKIDGNVFGENEEGFIYYLQGIDVPGFKCAHGTITSSEFDDFDKDFNKLSRFVTDRMNRHLTDRFKSK